MRWTSRNGRLQCLIDRRFDLTARHGDPFRQAKPRFHHVFIHVNVHVSVHVNVHATLRSVPVLQLYKRVMNTSKLAEVERNNSLTRRLSPDRTSNGPP